KPFGDGAQRVMDRMTTGPAPTSNRSSGSSSVGMGGVRGFDRSGFIGRHHNSIGSVPIVVTAPLSGGYYGSRYYDPVYGDPYAAGVENQNNRLRDRIKNLEDQNDLLRREINRGAAGQDVKRRAAAPDPVAIEQQRLTRERVKQATLAG